jgi:predicted RNase H-like HicB family nuclease
MKKNRNYYRSLEYPITIERMEDGLYCASIPLLTGCKGYGETQKKALNELHGVKEALLEMMVEQRKPIPEPTIRLEIPTSTFSRIRNKKQLEQFVHLQ